VSSGSPGEQGRQIEPLQIKRWVGETTFERGLDYADRSKVSDAARDGDVLTAEVEGSVPRGEDEPARYHVRVDLEPPVPRAGCTCPVRRPFCKHAAAVLITWQRSPEAFAAAGEPEEESSTPDGSEVSKADQRRRARLNELNAVDDMVRELGLGGIAAKGRQWADAIPDMMARARRRRQLRLAAVLEAVHREATAPPGGDEGFAPRRWADLLADLWFTLEATRHCVEGRPVDERALEQLAGRAPREAGLARRYQVLLLELAYEVFSGPLGTRHDVSYLMDLNSGETFVERVLVPASRAKRQELKPSHDAPLLAREMGVYPGYPPLRVALIDVEEGPVDVPSAASQALELAETSLPAIHQRLAGLAREPFAPRQTFALLGGADVVERDGVLHVRDADGYAVPLADSPLPHAPTVAAFEEHISRRSPAAVFARFFVDDDAVMRAAPLSIVEASGVTRLSAIPPSA